MKWQITLFGLLLCGFFSFFGLSSPTYAVSDLVKEFPAGSSVSSGTHMFPSCESVSCLSQYKYLIVESDFYSWSCSNTLYFFYSDSGTKYFNYSCTSTFSIYSINFKPNLQYITISQLPNNNYAWKFTLTDDYQSCPEPEPCPVVPDHPYDDKFDNIEKAIYVCGAILIMLYFFYCIYRMIIKGSGVN